MLILKADRLTIFTRRKQTQRTEERVSKLEIANLRRRGVLPTVAVTTFAMCISSIGVANAVDTSRSPTADVQSVTSNSIDLATADNFQTSISDAEMKKVEEEVKTLFTRYVPVIDGKFSVNESNLNADGLSSRVVELRNFANSMNLMALQESGAVSTPGMTTYGGKEFAECLIRGTLGVSATTIPGLINAIITGVKAWNWGLVASTVARIVGPIALRSIGGPLGLAAALAGTSAACLPDLWK